MKFKVGQKYKWDHQDQEGNGIFTITKVENTQISYMYDDGVRGLGCTIGSWFDKAILLYDTTIFMEPIKKDEAVIPSHYNSTSITALQVIDDWKLNFYLGNAIKYIARNELKGNQIQDLKKAGQYLQLYIDKLEQESK